VERERFSKGLEKERKRRPVCSSPLRTHLDKRVATSCSNTET
jgi:hypothetical protein